MKLLMQSGVLVAMHRWYEREVTTLLDDASDLPSTTDIGAAATLFFCAIQGLAFQSAIARYRRSHVSHGPRRSCARGPRPAVAWPVEGCLPRSDRAAVERKDMPTRQGGSF
jgi:hypothetical protein